MTDPRIHTILNHLLPLAATQGWTDATLKSAAQQAGETGQTIPFLFPNGISDALSAWQKQIDAAMVARVTAQGWASDRVRDKVAQCVWTRLEIIGEHHDAFRHATRQRLWHPKIVTGDLWHSADAIWNVAGDTSSDYNHYTKRLLLAKLLFKTTLSYLGDTSPAYADTRAYLDTQIENIVTMGQKLGTLKPALTKIWSLAERMGFRVETIR